MKTVTAALALGVMLAAQACAKPAPAPALTDQPIGEATVVTVRGWVDAVDKANRTVRLKGPRGGTVTLDVKDPQKLDAIQVGDPVLASYVEALAVQVKKAGTASPVCPCRNHASPPIPARPRPAPSGAKWSSSPPSPRSTRPRKL